MNRYIEIFTCSNDIRFGQYSILQEGDIENSKIIKKKLKFDGLELYNQKIVSLSNRVENQSNCILKLLRVVEDPIKIELNLFYEFPSSSFNIKDLNTDFLLKFCDQLLNGLVYLQKLGLHHNNICPFFLTWVESQKTFKLIENLSDFENAQEIQILNVKNYQPLYVSPVTFTNLINENTKYTIDKTKEDVFGFGMVLLEYFLDPEEIQKVYDYHNKCFDYKLFECLLLETRKYQDDQTLDLVLKFIWNCLLRVEEDERMTPIEALKEFKKTMEMIGQDESNETDMIETQMNEIKKLLSGKPTLNFYDPFEFIDQDKIQKDVIEKINQSQNPNNEKEIKSDDCLSLNEENNFFLERFLSTPKEEIQVLKKRISGMSGEGLAFINELTCGNSNPDQNWDLENKGNQNQTNIATFVYENNNFQNENHINQNQKDNNFGCFENHEVIKLRNEQKLNNNGCSFPIHDSKLMHSDSSLSNSQDNENPFGYLQNFNINSNVDFEKEKQENKQIAQLPFIVLFKDDKFEPNNAIESKTSDKNVSSLKLSDYLKHLVHHQHVTKQFQKEMSEDSKKMKQSYEFLKNQMEGTSKWKRLKQKTDLILKNQDQKCNEKSENKFVKRNVFSYKNDHKIPPRKLRNQNASQKQLFRINPAIKISEISTKDLAPILIKWEFYQKEILVKMINQKVCMIWLSEKRSKAMMGLPSKK